MPHTTAFYDWESRVNTLFDTLKPHQRRALAEYSFGKILTRCCGLTSVVAYLAVFLQCKTHTLRQRLRELYQPASAQIGAARSEFDSRLLRSLVRWAAGNLPDKHLILALDPTNLTDRFRVLCAAVLYRGCGLPVAWAVQDAKERGSWNTIWFDLLGQLKAALGEGWTVLVLTDRGLESVELFREIVRLGWHPLMHAKARGAISTDRLASWLSDGSLRGQSRWPMVWYGRGLSRQQCVALYVAGVVGKTDMRNRG